MSDGAKRKLKVLCLHGYRQNSEKFRSQTGGLRKFVKQYADFTYISAPHTVNTEDNEGIEQRCWWFTKPGSFSSKDETDMDTGFEESLNLIKDAFSSLGPFDGVLGFSQGAALTAILCALKQRNELDVDFKFVVIVSGFRSKCSKHFSYYTDKFTIPSLQIMGESDNIVVKSVSEGLADVFVDPVIMRHDGGHYVPLSGSLKEQYRCFFMERFEALNG